MLEWMGDGSVSARAGAAEEQWGSESCLGTRKLTPTPAFSLQLAPDDAWRCPHCKQLQQGSITLSLWTLPDVLIIHLKRFRQVRMSVVLRIAQLGSDLTAPPLQKQLFCPAWSSPHMVASLSPQLTLFSVCAGGRPKDETSEYG